MKLYAKRLARVCESLDGEVLEAAISAIEGKPPTFRQAIPEAALPVLDELREVCQMLGKSGVDASVDEKALLAPRPRRRRSNRPS